MRSTRLQRNTDIPIPDSSRRCTDIVWLIFPVLFFLFFIYCLLVFNAQYVKMMSAPTDGQGIVCDYGAETYNYLYIVDTNDIRNRICVRKCPFNVTKVTTVKYNLQKGTSWTVTRGAQVQLQHPALAKMHANNIYDSVPFETIRGDFCIPVNEVLKQKLVINSDMIWWQGFLGNFSFVWILSTFSIILFGIYIALLLYYSKYMDVIVPVLGGLMISTFGVNLMFYSTRYFISFNRVMLGLFLFVFGALIFLCSMFYRKQLKAHGVFLEQAAKMMKAHMRIHAYIFIFVVLAFLLIGLSLYQFFAVWSARAPTFNPNEIYYNATSQFSQFFTCIIVFQLFWGLTFLKQTFNYCVSSVATDYYFSHNSIKGLFSPMFKAVRYHLGSLYYGSFFITIFKPLSFVQSISNSKDLNIRMDRACSNIWRPCSNILEIVRSDAFAFISFSGKPYRYSAYYCNQLQNELSSYRDIYMASRLFRIGSYLLMFGFMGYFALYVRYSMSMSALILLFFIMMVISMFFVGLYADVAQAFNIAFLAEQYKLEDGGIDTLQQRNSQVYNPQHKVIQSINTPMNKPIYNPLNQVIARQANRDAGLTSDHYSEPPPIFGSSFRAPSTFSQQVQNQIGYNFKSMAETGVR